MKAKVEELSRAFLQERLKDPAYLKFYLEEQFRLSLGSEITRVRKEKKWSQQELAKNAGLNPAAIAKLEKGEYHRITLKLIVQIAEALNQKVTAQFEKRS